MGKKKVRRNTPKYLFEWVKEHPAQTAVGVLSAPLIPEGLAGMVFGLVAFNKEQIKTPIVMVGVFLLITSKLQ